MRAPGKIVTFNVWTEDSHVVAVPVFEFRRECVSSASLHNFELSLITQSDSSLLRPGPGWLFIFMFSANLRVLPHFVVA